MKTLYTWGFIALMVVVSSAGDVLLAKAMTKIGDLDVVRREKGLLGAARTVLASPWFMGGIGCMTVAFFSLLIALNWSDLSLVAPASASLTFVCTAFGAKFFLDEKLDLRRWIAVALVCVGVMLLAG